MFSVHSLVNWLLNCMSFNQCTVVVSPTYRQCNIIKYKSSVVSPCMLSCICLCLFSQLLVRVGTTCTLLRWPTTINPLQEVVVCSLVLSPEPQCSIVHPSYPLMREHCRSISRNKCERCAMLLYTHVCTHVYVAYVIVMSLTLLCTTSRLLGLVLEPTAVNVTGPFCM